MRIHIIRTYFPHWSKYSGYNRFIDYLPPDVKISTKAIPMHQIGERKNFWHQQLDKKTPCYFPPGYERFDFFAEATAFIRWFIGGLDVVHYIDGEHGPFFLPQWMRRCRVRKPANVIVSYHQPREILRKYIRHELAGLVDTYIVLCQDQKRFLQERFPGARVKIVPHGIDTDYFMPKFDEKMREADGMFHLISVGSWMRDCNSVLETARLMPEDKFRFHIVGFQPSEDKMTSNVVLHKNLSDQDLLSLYQSCDAVFLPLVDATANNVVLESMACGLPVVSSNIEAIREYVTDSCGFFVSGNDPKVFSKILINLFENKTLLNDMGKAAQKRAQELSWQKVTKQIVQIYKEPAKTPLPNKNVRRQRDKNMRIVLVNSLTEGGAARAALRLLKGFNTLGHETVMLSKQASNGHSNIKNIAVSGYTRDQTLEKTYVNINRTDLSTTLFSINHYCTPDLKAKELRRANIINLHWVAHMISPRALFDLSQLGKPLVWTLHDQRAFTGGCHYTAGCRGFETGCQNCLQLRDDWAHLPTHAIKEMQQAIEGVNLTVVTPSAWLAREAEKSLLFRNVPVKVIPNGIETDIFFPEDKKQAKQKLGLNPKSFILQFSAENTIEPRKGLKELVGALELCLKEPEFRKRCESREISILCMGKPDPDLEAIPIGKNVMGYIKDDSVLQRAYSATDVFILPSLEDNLPNAILESMACGTPLIAFDTGGARDVITEDCGVVVPKGDVKALAKSILQFTTDVNMRQALTAGCRHKIEAGFTIEHQAKRYEALFEELLSQKYTKRVRKKPFNSENTAFDSILRTANKVLGIDNGFFTQGWHELEQDDTCWWRWSSGRGKIEVHHPTGEQTDLYFSVRSIFHLDQIKLMVNGKKAGNFQASSKIQSVGPFTVPLDRGNNDIELVSSSGARPPSQHEPRRLSFLVSAFRITESSLNKNMAFLPKPQNHFLVIGFSCGEQVPADWWSCNRRDGTIHIKSKGTRTTNLSLFLSSINEEDELMISLNGREVERIKGRHESCQIGPVQIVLKAGTNILAFASDKAFEPPSTGYRSFSFTIKDLKIDPMPDSGLKWKDRFALWRQQKCFKKSGLFFKRFYCRQVPELSGKKINPLLHYILYGAWDNKNPNPLFDSAWYLSQYRDVYVAGENPLCHYMIYGWKEGRDPHPEFSTERYLSDYEDVRKSGMNPLLHYLLHGILEGRKIHPGT